MSGASVNGSDFIKFSSSLSPSLPQPTFQIVNEINNTLIGSNIGVTASYTGSNLQFWNNLSQSIKDNTIFDIINIVTSSGGAGHPQATFRLTSSTNNEIYNDYFFRTDNGTVGQPTFISSGSFTGGDTEVDAAFDMVLAVPGRNKDGNNHRTETIISSKFSAPGGPEVQSAGFLDVYSREYSVHNAMPYRNLTVRGKSSGEIGTIRLNTHLDKREGLATLLTRHCGKFGIDSRYGAVSETSYNTSASFHKQHRNTLSKYILSGTVGSTTESVVLGSKKDNALVASPLPRSEFQYSWINSAVSGTGNWKSQHNILGYAPPSGLMQEKNVYNGYAHFYSQTSYINIGTGTTWNNILNTAPYRFSIGGWFQRKSTSHSNGAFLYHFGDSSTGVVSLFLTSLGALIFRTYGDGALKTWQTANGTIADDSWYNIVITHNGSGTILLYLNGVLTSWGSSSSFSSWGGIRPSGDCFLGNQSESSVQYLDGYIDSFFIMNALAAANDILTLYRQEREYYNPVSIYAGNTKGFYKLDSRGLSWDPKFVDSSGQGNDSIASNNVAVIEEFDYADIFPINFPSASEIFGE